MIMKMKFNQFEDYHSVSNIQSELKPRIADWRNYRGNHRKLDYSKTCIDIYMGDNVVYLVNDIEIGKYNRLIDLLIEKYPMLMDYNEDLAVVVAYMNKHGYGGDKYNNNIFAKDVNRHRQDFKDAEDLLRDIEQKQLKIHNITITASDKGMQRDLVIFNDTLMKILLNGFAEELYCNYYDYEYKDWHDQMMYGDSSKVKEDKDRTDEFVTRHKNNISAALFNMLHNEGLAKGWSDRKMIKLFCDLLIIADAIKDGAYTKESNIINSIQTQISRHYKKSGVKIIEPPTVKELGTICSLKDYIIYNHMSGKGIKEKSSPHITIENFENQAHYKWFAQLNRYRVLDLDSVLK